MQKQTIRWVWIALAYIIFFPVGIWLMYKKVVSEKARYDENGKVLKIYGWIFFIMGIFYVISGITGEVELFKDGDIATGITVLLLFLGGGLFLIIKGMQLCKRGKKYNRYVSIVSTISDSTISNIAKAYPDTYDNTLKELQKMMEIGFFSACRLDLESGRIIRPETFEKIMPLTYTVTCPSCGAINRVADTHSATCEYCSTPLK